ncbi:MAG TPA: hypothetical protein VGF59_05540, partial [Bryobacteraceae bacterium]
MRRRTIWLALLFTLVAQAAAPKRILYVTTTAGYRHADSIDASVQVFDQIAKESGAMEIVHTEDLAALAADNLRNFDAVYFF